MPRINAAAVRCFREARLLTITELARRSGIPQPNLSKIEAGNLQCSWPRLVTLADVLNVPVDAIVGDDEPVSAETWPIKYRARVA